MLKVPANPFRLFLHAAQMAGGRLDQLQLGARRCLSSLNGGTNPHRDYADIIDLARRGELDIDTQVTRVWPLAEVDDAIAALRSGQVMRAVLDHTA